MPSKSIPTMRVEFRKSPGNVLIINRDDFNPDVHQLPGDLLKKPNPLLSSKIEKSDPLYESAKAKIKSLAGIGKRREELLAIYEPDGPEGSKNWRAIKAIAEQYGITAKPEGGWDDAIEMILKAEFGDNA